MNIRLTINLNEGIIDKFEWVTFSGEKSQVKYDLNFKGILIENKDEISFIVEIFF